jgi:hypothetical protein
MRQRRETVEHPFGTLKMRMGATHFLMRRLPKVASEMALHVRAAGSGAIPIREFRGAIPSGNAGPQCRSSDFVDRATSKAILIWEEAMPEG